MAYLLVYTVSTFFCSSEHMLMLCIFSSLPYCFSSLSSQLFQSLFELLIFLFLLFWTRCRQMRVPNSTVGVGQVRGASETTVGQREQSQGDWLKRKEKARHMNFFFETEIKFEPRLEQKKGKEDELCKPRRTKNPKSRIQDREKEIEWTDDGRNSQRSDTYVSCWRNHANRKSNRNSKVNK